jgi:WhiB family transcriptional regulator, redox-sensing transcriptional regulator
MKVQVSSLSTGKFTPCTRHPQGVGFSPGSGRPIVSVQRIGSDREQLWQDKAACRGPQSSHFFPPSHFERKDEKEAREARAKAICQICSVKEPCLEFAISIREPHGIWGGLNEIERKQVLTRRLG